MWKRKYSYEVDEDDTNLKKEDSPPEVEARTQECHHLGIAVKVKSEDASFSQDDNLPEDLHKLEQDHVDLQNMKLYFPEPVWKKVMEKLESKEDVENCSNASPFFRTLLQEKRLQQVFGILGRRFADVTNKDESYKETDLESIPWRRPADNNEAHPITGILKCRLVKKSWNQAIEKVFEDKQFAGSRLLDIGMCILDKNVTPQMFLEHFNQSHGQVNLKVKNPFLGRCVSLFFDDDLGEGDRQAFHNGCLEVAEKYGAEIWHLKIWNLDSNVNRLHKFYRKVREIVQLTPNLVAFTIYSSSSTFRFPDLTALEEEMANNAFPKLGKIKNMELQCLPAVILRQILNQNLHITRLTVWRDNEHMKQDCPVFVGNFVNLRELFMNVTSLGDFGEFENCPFPLNLTKCEMHFEKSVPFLPWSRVFGAVESKLNKELCTDLVLTLPSPRFETEKKLVLRESLDYRLNLPNLIKFTIYNEMPFCLDFLLRSKNTLSEIEVYGWNNLGSDYKRFKEEQVIKFLGYRDNIQDSNIRLKLPRLKKLSGGHSPGYICYEFGSDGVIKR